MRRPFTRPSTTHYEEAFVSLPLLVSFMPMLMDTAGNCGNQISTLKMCIRDSVGAGRV